MRIFVSALLVVASIFSSSAFAERVDWKHEVTVGFGGAYGGDIDKNDAVLGSHLKSKQSTYSIALSYRYLQLRQAFAEVNFDFRGFQDSRHTLAGKLINDGHDMFYALGLNLGYPFALGDHWIGVPLIGIESHSSRLSLAYNATSVPTVQAYLVRRWTDASLGFYCRGEIHPNWDLGLKLSVAYPVSTPTVTTNLMQDVVGGATKVNLGKAWNFRLELPLDYALDGEQSFLQFAPFVETQNMGAPSKKFGSTSVNKDVFTNYLIGARINYNYRL